jgi:hypothetical protein
MAGLEDDGDLCKNRLLTTDEAVSGRPPQPYRWVLGTARPFSPILGLENPARPVDARWNAAAYLVRRGITLPAPHEDPWVERATRYLEALLACQTEADREKVGRAYPGLDAAFRLHADPDKLRRGLLQGRRLPARRSMPSPPPAA